MKKVLCSVFCLSLAALVAGAAGDNKTPKIEGSWSGTGGIAKGKKIPEDFIAKIMLLAVFKDGKYTVSVMGKEIESGTYKVDAAKKPATIDLVIKEGNDKGKTQLGIYKIEGDQITFAIGTAGSDDRPKNFEGGEKVEVTLGKRIK